MSTNGKSNGQITAPEVNAEAESGGKQTGTIMDTTTEMSNKTSMIEVANILKNISGEQETLEKLSENDARISEIKQLMLQQKKELEAKLKPQARFSEGRLLEVVTNPLKPQERIMARVELLTLKNSLQYINTALGIIHEKMRLHAGKRKTQLLKQRLQMKSISGIYLRKNIKNLQKRICRLFNEVLKNEDKKEMLVVLQSHTSNEEEFNSNLLTFLKEMDEETYILLSGRTKYQSQILGKIMLLLNDWNPSEGVDFVAKLENTMDISSSNSTFIKLNEEITNAVPEKI
jgi:hypothetical protein